MASNQDMFTQIHGLLTNKASEFFSNVARAIMNYPLPWFGFDGKTQPAGARNTTNLGAFLGWIDSGLNNLSTGIGEIKVALAGLQAAVAALGKQQGIDPKELTRIVDEAVGAAADKHLGTIGTYELRKVEETK